MLFQKIRDQVPPLLLEGDRKFLNTLALLAVDIPPPVGFVKNRIAERDGSQQEKLDLFHRGILPMVNLVRLFALFQGRSGVLHPGPDSGLEGKGPGL